MPKYNLKPLDLSSFRLLKYPLSQMTLTFFESPLTIAVSFAKSDTTHLDADEDGRLGLLEHLMSLKIGDKIKGVK
jgi:hypothetical protein